jgi:predicted ATPase/class 3 adenylate cyclase
MSARRNVWIVSQLASGTVTFLFTDLEGSTRLWEERPEAMRSALALHDVLVHGAIAQHDGHLVKSTGDGVFAVFERAQDAVAAAVAAQVGLGGADWPDGLALRARMGMHSGQASERDGDYFGPDVNRAVRVTSSAHGGQIVCSASVATFVGDQVVLRDLGEHRLRDLQSSVHLFQVDAPGLESAFAPLRSLDAYRSNLPFELSSFVGRAEEAGAVAELLRASRVVSIVGGGGVGKTRLALQVGSDLLPHYPDGVWLCELASVLEPDGIADAVAASVGCTPPVGVSVAEALPAFLERKDLLLILDNCEHLVGAVASFVTATTAFAARVSVLATSREALGVRGEHVSTLPSLGLPVGDDVAAVLASEAGAVFVARARQARGDLFLDDANAPAVNDLCVRLDGIPLAIELAAAQTALMTPVEILTRLDRQFRLLSGGRRTALERHQTLRAAIDWSYDLLDDAEHSLLDRLSVCVGGFDLDAAAVIAAGSGVDEFTALELLGSLVAKSLVERSDRSGVTRFRLLEMIRQYAAERLAAGGVADVARDDHARYFLEAAIGIVAEVSTPADYDALDRLEAETANIAAAGRWLLATDRVEELLEFFRRLPWIDYFALPATTVEELGRLAVDAMEEPGASTLPGCADASVLAAVRAFVNGDMAQYRNLVELARQSTDAAARPRINLAESALALGLDSDVARAISHARAAVDSLQDSRRTSMLSWALAQLSVLEALLEADSAIPHAEAAVMFARQIGSAVAQLYPLVAIVQAVRRVDPPRAIEAAEECARLDHTRRKIWKDTSQVLAAGVRFGPGEIAEGLKLQRETLRHLQESGSPAFLAMALANTADALVATEPAVAVELAAIAESDAIAPFAAFSVYPELTRLADELTSAAAAARGRVPVGWVARLD